MPRPHQSTEHTPEGHIQDLQAQRIITEKDIFVPDAISPELVAELLKLCKTDGHDLFLQGQSDYADIDELRVFTRGTPAYDNHALFNRVIDLANNPQSQAALKTAFEDADLMMREILIVRMGPGTYNFKHSHHVYTANILLQDNPREEGSNHGVFFTTFHDYTRQTSPERMVGPFEYSIDHDPILRGLRARKPNVGHGVHPIPGERQHADVNPDDCRYVLTYVFEGRSTVVDS